MLTYKAMYKFLPQGVHAEVMDFPGAITSAATLAEARELLSSALVDMAEECLLRQEPLPAPDPSVSDPESDIEEPIHLILQASNRVLITPKAVAS